MTIARTDFISDNVNSLMVAG